jgi:hypothetical protein
MALSFRTEAVGEGFEGLSLQGGQDQDRTLMRRFLLEREEAGGQILALRHGEKVCEIRHPAHRFGWDLESVNEVER